MVLVIGTWYALSGGGTKQKGFNKNIFVPTKLYIHACRIRTASPFRGISPLWRISLICYQQQDVERWWLILFTLLTAFGVRQILSFCLTASVRAVACALFITRSAMRTSVKKLFFISIYILYHTISELSTFREFLK